MAIYHCSVKVISRSQGRSSVGASAYRSGERLYNERDGLAHDYRNKQGIEHKEILTPSEAPEWVNDREKLWNKVEKTENRKDSQLAREVEVSLPVELNREKQIDLIRDYAKTFTDKGMVADLAVHDKGDGNPHAHILLTMRPVDKEGFGNKAREWNSKEQLEQWREEWADKTNKHLERAGYKERIDHRSFKEQGIEKIPTLHEGHVVKAMEQRGIETDVGNKNREIKAQNRIVELIDKQISSFEKQRGLLVNDRSTNSVDGIRDKDNRIGNRIDECQERREHDVTKIERAESGIKSGAGEQYLEGVLSGISREIRDIEARAGQKPHADRGGCEGASVENQPDRGQQQDSKQRHRERDFGIDR